HRITRSSIKATTDHHCRSVLSLVFLSSPLYSTFMSFPQANSCCSSKICHEHHRT
ncbi:hypothetical protein HAX54_008042, partial [Datura stramonium]|nr:hypothetical protein [Datura stramonium]